MLAAVASTSACTLLVDTGGLSGESGTERGDEAGDGAASELRSADASTATDAGDAATADGRPGRCTVVGPRAPAAVTGWMTSSGARSAGDGVVATGDGADGPLVATDFGFVVPASARIAGVTATILRRADSGGMRDAEVALVGGPRASASRARPEPWSLAMSPISYGTLDDTWNAGLDGSHVTSPTFGLSLSVAGAAPTGSVDSITLTVQYCE
ncbi:MAG: hypothetical protein JST00_13620 [Deltaproteobacteria bacterium]|nr:hypothetical protein [Deltaproteobacteria bacterium]